MNKLLSEEELRKKCKKLHHEYQSRVDDNVVDDGKTAWIWFYDSLVELIQSQKLSHANKVVRSIKSKIADKSIVVILNEFQSGYDTAIVDCIEIVGTDIRERNK